MRHGTPGLRSHGYAEGFMNRGSTLTGYAFLLGYVVLVVLLSRVFLGESLSWPKIAGILLTIAGVALLSLEET